MTCVKLHCPADLLKLTTAAHAARRTALQEISVDATDDERRGLEAALLKRTAIFLGVLNICITTEEGGTSVDEADKRDAPDAVASIAGLEGEVQQLQEEVLAASQRVMQLRSSVPVALSENLREKLEQCRPSLEPSAAAGAPEADAQQDTGECNEAALSPAPAELQGSFASAVLKMPTLRAKLEDALERLQRIVGAMAADAAQAPPNTVERAAKGLATPVAGGVPAAAAAATAGGGEATPSPKLAEALSSGKIATRRRIASHLRPVPYPRQ